MCEVTNVHPLMCSRIPSKVVEVHTSQTNQFLHKFNVYKRTHKK